MLNYYDDVLITNEALRADPVPGLVNAEFAKTVFTNKTDFERSVYEDALEWAFENNIPAFGQKALMEEYWATKLN